MEGFRLAGLSNEEFADLLRVQTEERGRLLLHLRRKPLMRLRAGFDGHSGGISDDDGVLILQLHFEGGSYQERQLVRGTVDFIEDPTLQLSAPPRSALLITGAMRWPLASLFPTIPRCLRPRSIVALTVNHERFE